MGVHDVSDLTDFLEARMRKREAEAQLIPQDWPDVRSFAIDHLVSVRGLINLHGVAGHDCPGRDGGSGRIADYEQDCPTLMLLAHPYRFHSDWRGEWKA
jgi:hypothetical protein